MATINDYDKSYRSRGRSGEKPEPTVIQKGKRRRIQISSCQEPSKDVDRLLRGPSSYRVNRNLQSSYQIRSRRRPSSHRFRDADVVELSGPYRTRRPSPPIRSRSRSRPRLGRERHDEEPRQRHRVDEDLVYEEPAELPSPDEPENPSSDDYSSDASVRSSGFMLLDYALDETRFPIVDDEVSASDDSSAVQPSDGTWNEPLRDLLSHIGSSISQSAISQSRWLGNTFDNTQLRAELTVIDDHPAALIKWFHLERPLMNFQEFISISQRVFQLPDDDRRHLTELLTDIQRKHEKQRQHGREMEPICESDVALKDEGLDVSAQTASYLFFNLPLFQLLPYSANRGKSLGPESASHPSRPMIEAHTGISNAKREMSQVIAIGKDTQHVKCLHISSVWCLIVNETTMLTCSHLSFDALKGQLVNVVKPPHDLGLKNIRVTAGSGHTREWRFPAEKVSTLPSLLSLFCDRVSEFTKPGSIAKLTYQGKNAGSQAWSSLLAKLSAKPSTTLVLENHEASPHEKLMLLNQHDNYLQSRFGSGAGLDSASNDEIVRSLLMSVSSTRSAEMSATHGDRIHEGPMSSTGAKLPTLQLLYRACQGNQSSAVQLADSLERTLTSNLPPTEKEAYSTCPSARLEDLQNWANSAQESNLQKLSPNEVKDIRNYQMALLLAALYAYGFFWPWNFEHPLTNKVFGALLKFVTNDKFYETAIRDGRKTEESRRDVIEYYDMVFFPIAALSEWISGNEKCLQPVPGQFCKAWLHFMMAIIALPQVSRRAIRSRNDTLTRSHLYEVQKHLADAETLLTNRLRPGELEDFEVCLPKSIAALLLDRATRDVMDGSPDVAQTYEDYSYRLEANLNETPHLRSHQAALRSYLQELVIVSKTLESQLTILNTYAASLRSQDQASSVPELDSLADPRHYHVLDSTIARLEARIDLFQSLQTRALDLSQWHLGEIENTKDRQESAIFIFTVVTIIFLPLSFVASVLGINTNDVRNMTQGQWVYWATALPLTMIVVLGSLWWAGELEGIGMWIARVGKKGPKGYQPVQEDPVDSRTSGRRVAYADDVYASRDKPRSHAAPARTRTTYPINVYPDRGNTNRSRRTRSRIQPYGHHRGDDDWDEV